MDMARPAALILAFVVAFSLPIVSAQSRFSSADLYEFCLTSNVDDAIARCSEYLRTYKDDRQDIYSWRGKAYSRKGQYALAIADFKEAIRISADDPDIPDADRFDYFIDLGHAYRMTGEYVRASVTLGYALVFDGIDAAHRSWALAERGAALYENKEYRAALDDLNESLKLNPKDTFAQEYRVKALEALKPKG